MNEVITGLPVVALRGMTILPYMVIHFDFNRKNLIETVEYAMLHGQKIFITGNLEDNKDDKAEEKLRRIGTVCEIKQIMKPQGNVLRILVRGLNRGNSLAYNMDDRIMLANVDISDDMEERADELILTAHARDIKELDRKSVV